MLDTVRLRVLAAVAEHGSITRAAEQLHYSQPAVSHHLARLEAETGVRLVQRAGRGIRLTAEGELLARRATEIVGRLAAADEELAALVGLRTGRVRVGGFQSAFSTLIPQAAARLLAASPQIELQMTDLHPDLALQMLRDGKLDCAVIFRYDDEVPEGFRCVPLFDDVMHLVSRRAGDTLADHRDSAWIAGCERCRRDFVAACAAAGFTPRIAFTSEDVVVEQALVAAGLGVTTLPGLALRSHRAPGIQATPIAAFRRRVLLATFGDPPDPPATAAFNAAIRAVVSEE
ncbi:LysR family transcriptional regulator [Pseudonocardia sp. CA-107938]|uniref:LysR family transcriptional regulator n=1 Tax=Pseudonocardia sp. CA-107938 TaxID=3240021 RepID=UPI003D8F20F5